MALDFPLLIRLREEEHEAVLRLLDRERLLSRTEVATGALGIGLSIAEDPEGYKEFLGYLRNRKQGQKALISRKPPQSEASPVPQAAPRRNRRCA